MDSDALHRLRLIAASLQRDGETQEEMCARVGLKRSKWLGWVGGRKPNSDGYWELARALGIDVVELMARIEGKKYRADQGKSWAELGREAISDPAKLREFMSELDPEQITALMAAALSVQGEKLQNHR